MRENWTAEKSLSTWPKRTPTEEVVVEVELVLEFVLPVVHHQVQSEAEHYLEIVFAAQSPANLFVPFFFLGQ